MNIFEKGGLLLAIVGLLFMQSAPDDTRKFICLVIFVVGCAIFMAAEKVQSP